MISKIVIPTRGYGVSESEVDEVASRYGRLVSIPEDPGEVTETITDRSLVPGGFSDWHHERFVIPSS